jgi:hypothetical protein
MKGHLVNDECSRIKNYDIEKIANGGGRTFFLKNDAIWGETHKSSRDPKSCQAELGKQIKRGEVIALSGQVGKHEFSSIKIKVKSDKQNPLMLKNKGDPYLHWVQPATFFTGSALRLKLNFQTVFWHILSSAMISKLIYEKFFYR